MNQSFAFFFVPSSVVLLMEGYLTNMQEGKTHLIVFFFSYHARPPVTCSNRVCHRHVDIQRKKEKKTD